MSSLKSGSPVVPGRRGGNGTRVAVLAVVLLLLAGFVALGVWQLERRTWKLALIERVEQRVHAAPIDPPPRARWASVDAADDEYRHVRVDGTFLDVPPAKVLAVTEYGRGWWILAPLRTPRGEIVLVDRGFVAADAAPRAPPAGPVTVVGLLRVTEPGGSFLHDNDPAHDRWYSRDVQAIAAARDLHPVAPYFIDADAASGADASSGQPVGGLTVVAFRNDHLSYAITWFVLAALCVAAVWRLRRAHERYDVHE